VQPTQPITGGDDFPSDPMDKRQARRPIRETNVAMHQAALCSSSYHVRQRMGVMWCKATILCHTSRRR
jgi:hypothetical protein